MQVVADERTSLPAGVMATQSTGRPDRGGVSGIEAAHEVRCAPRSPVELLLDGPFRCNFGVGPLLAPLRFLVVNKVNSIRRKCHEFEQVSSVGRCGEFVVHVRLAGQRRRARGRRLC